MKREKIQVVCTATAGNNNTTRGRTGLMMGADITALRADGEAHTTSQKFARNYTKYRVLIFKYQRVDKL